jgi:hypothetical protein
VDITIKINCDNAAFDGHDCGSEVARILHALAGRIEAYSVDDFTGIKLRDINGNSVGEMSVND